MLTLPMLLTGCLEAPAEEGESTLSTEGALLEDNALLPNALLPNALLPNALLPNALLPNALLPNALSPSALSAIQDPSLAGFLSRLFLKYTVGCALKQDQSFNFSWTDEAGVLHAETYKGSVGIAPEWVSGPIDAVGQEMVSACLAARTNWYGTPVTISMRSYNKALRTPPGDETTAYPDVEGVFWGNIFSATPYLRACYNERTIGNSRAAHRDCAVGHIDEQGAVTECGMIHILGSCASLCKQMTPGTQYYKHCNDPERGTTERVITTALP